MESALFQELVNMREYSLADIAAAKKEGKKVVGYYCNYTPLELPLAGGAIVLPLCGSREGPLVAADHDLPQNLCPVVRTMYDLAATDKCPFFHLCDMIIAETTCDGKKKVYELLQRIKPVHVMNLPQIPGLPGSLQMWESEVLRLKGALEQNLGLTITEGDLRQAVHITNEEARVKKELFDLNQASPALFSGTDLLKITSNVEFTTDREATVALLDSFIKEIKTLAGQGYHVGPASAPRVMLTGCPVGDSESKVIDLVEESGGLVVAMENCGGYKTVDLRIDEDDSRNIITLLAEKYLKVPCSVMTPNDRRLKLLETMAREFDVGGVIDLTWQACHTYNVESYWVSDLVNNRLGKAFLHLETNFSETDRENLRVRIEALLEMIKSS